MKNAILKLPQLHLFTKLMMVVLAVLVLLVNTARNASAACGTTNIALNKATSNSTFESPFVSGNAVDGNATTRWGSGFSDPQWITVDLGTSQSVCRVVLRWEAAYGRSYQIQTSTNNSTWTTIYSTTTGDGGVDDLTVNGAGRYIRMNGTARGTQYGYSLFEFEIYAGTNTTATPTTPPPTTPPPTTPPPTTPPPTTPPPTTPPPGCGTTNVALNKPATSSSNENTGTTPNLAVDGNAGTRWSSTYVDPSWIRIDLGSTTSICRVVLTWETAYGRSYQIQTSNDGTNWTTIYSTTTGDGGTDNLTVSGSGRYIRMNGTARATQWGYSLWEFVVNSGTSAVTPTPTTPPPTTPPPTTPSGTCTQPANPDFGPNVRIFDPSMSAATIQAQLDADFNAMKDTQAHQFAETRRAHLFKPGTYNVYDNVGFYLSVQGLGLNPTDVTINGAITVDAFNASDAGNATQNFWRSAENMTINTNGGRNRWGVAQAAPFRRMNIIGGLDLFPASYGWASGGYISDTRVTGSVASASQQQWYSKDSNFGSWDGAVWNMVFSGVAGAPAPSFPASPKTVLATTPISRDVPYLYWDGSAYRVFVPGLRTNASGASWPNTPGTSLPMTQFYVVRPGATAADINNALNQSCNLFFTPGIYHVNQTINVNRANTVILGIGYPTIVNDNGVVAMQVGNVDGVRVKGILFDAGTTAASAQMIVGTAGNTTGHAANPITLQDVFFRVGGQFAGKTINSLVINAYDTIIDHTWVWRADHGAGVGWTVNTAEVGVVVNGNNVLATGLFVEHYQKWDVVWNGQNGRTIFFQNEIGYDQPNQAAFMDGSTLGYAAYKVAPNVTTHEGWGLASYVFFNVDTSIRVDHAFEAPNVPGVRFHNLSIVSLGNAGTILHVINQIGGPTPTNSTPATVTNYP